MVGRGGGKAEEAGNGEDSSQRLDKWLWFARVVRTRPVAADLATSGHVRINGQRVVSASRLVRIGDVLTIALDRRVLVLKVIRGGERRGAYSEARLLYEDLAQHSDDQNGERDDAGLRH